jgi:hypothetical protein
MRTMFARYMTSVRTSSRDSTLSSNAIRQAASRHHPYTAKWYGAHWVLVALAELRYPAGDMS